MGDTQQVILAVAGLLLLVWLTWLTFLLRRHTRGRNRLMRELSVDQVETLLAELLERADRSERQIQQLRDFRSRATGLLNQSLVAPALVRYNAYQDITGQLSFSLSLIDRRHTGLILTSLVGREGGRLYIKAVVDGRTEASLSDEEQQSLDEAITSIDTPSPS